MIREKILYRPAGLGLCLLALSATAGCAHFHNAEIRAEQQREGVQRAPALPEAPPQPQRTPQLTPAPAVPTAPVFAAPPPAPAPTAPAAATAPATDDAIIIFANTPGAHCGTCETLKISVAPSGQVLIERGSWASATHGNWRYKRSRADVGPSRAAAFAASLSAHRPVGEQLAGGRCSAPATGDDGLSIEWIEANRHDRLVVKFGCVADNAQIAEGLRHAPDSLGLRQLDFP